MAEQKWHIYRWQEPDPEEFYKSEEYNEYYSVEELLGIKKKDPKWYSEIRNKYKDALEYSIMQEEYKKKQMAKKLKTGLWTLLAIIIGSIVFAYVVLKMGI